MLLKTNTSTDYIQPREPLVGVGRAREVRVGGLVAEPRAGLLGDLEEPLVRPVHGAALAGPDLGVRLLVFFATVYRYLEYRCTGT